jgi:hypothetical protein
MAAATAKNRGSASGAYHGEEMAAPAWTNGMEGLKWARNPKAIEENGLTLAHRLDVKDGGERLVMRSCGRCGARRG